MLQKNTEIIPIKRYTNINVWPSGDKTKAQEVNKNSKMLDIFIPTTVSCYNIIISIICNLSTHVKNHRKHC